MWGSILGLVLFVCDSICVMEIRYFSPFFLRTHIVLSNPQHNLIFITTIFIPTTFLSTLYKFFMKLIL